MIEIIADVETIIRQVILSFVATVKEDGTAQSFAKGVFDGHKRLSLLRRHRIAPDHTELERNPGVEINVVDIFQRRGYRFKGPCVDTAAGP
ncbi:pyridoxamine 5'-phosphate oxidase family protein [Bradyrhizobium sp. 139]|uniref:pyridoxamine 5'-phosphate oxidase family protein n=1 Tax=Bradyrhizobium sp. 139 TaxID=2782616 RepID=UPI001FF952CF|nr:pyridoxamine 5'-phosphate oxidase family protein [Bradyrhizobium sp. 139]MCK1745751.1 pyridoxamine 5'-phosphate oxidase family protein [Bradyrhizobium sp. 139]